MTNRVSLLHAFLRAARHSQEMASFPARPQPLIKGSSYYRMSNIILHKRNYPTGENLLNQKKVLFPLSRRVFTLYAIGISIPWHQPSCPSHWPPGPCLCQFEIVPNTTSKMTTSHLRLTYASQSVEVCDTCLLSGCKNDANYLRHIFANKRMRHIFANTPFANW